MVRASTARAFSARRRVKSLRYVVCARGVCGRVVFLCSRCARGDECRLRGGDGVTRRADGAPPLVCRRDHQRRECLAPGREPDGPAPYRGRGAPQTRLQRRATNPPVAVRALAPTLPSTAWQTVRWRPARRGRCARGLPPSPAKAASREEGRDPLMLLVQNEFEARVVRNEQIVGSTVRNGSEVVDAQ